MQIFFSTNITCRKKDLDDIGKLSNFATKVKATSCKFMTLNICNYCLIINYVLLGVFGHLAWLFDPIFPLAFSPLLPNVETTTNMNKT